MARPLGLHQLSALDVGPLELIDIAAKTSCQEVSLFSQPIGASPLPLVTKNNYQALRSALAVNGLQMANIECFMLTPNTQVADYKAALELGAELGARGATVLLYDADENRVIDNLSGLAELAKPLNVRIGLEFMPLAAGWKSLQHATDLVIQLKPLNLGLGVDLLHLIRSGGTPEDLALIDPSLISHAQLCDGHHLGITNDYAEEATFGRQAPGDGMFPIQDFLKVLPKGLPVELEVPQLSDLSALERVQHVVAGARKQLALADMD